MLEPSSSLNQILINLIIHSLDVAKEGMNGAHMVVMAVRGLNLDWHIHKICIEAPAKHTR